MDNYFYKFYLVTGENEQFLGMGQGKYLTSEVSGGFTGTLLGLYATGNNKAEFTQFKLEY